MRLNDSDILKLIEEHNEKYFGCSADKATKQQLYKTICNIVKDMLIEKNMKFSRDEKENKHKHVYYMSMEFLVGTSLKNNLYNLGVEECFRDALKNIGVDIEDIYAIEPDAGLGNGGLGRLASCYMDSFSTLKIPATGYSIRYEFGIFKQKIVDGWQMEFPDDWLNLGDVWLNAKTDEAVEVKFGGRIEEIYDDKGYHPTLRDYNSVVAVPYEMFVSGYNSPCVNKLVLWSAKSKNNLDMSAFSRGDYAKALEENNKAEVISKVLYPADDHIQGKILRIRQQYFFVSASLQTIVGKHFKKFNTLNNLKDYVAIHINDTHPSLCVPELMRILVDEYGYPWDRAWEICHDVLSYTNHTVMREALEQWSEDMFSKELPRIYQIIAEINRRLREELFTIYGDDYAKIDYMSVISGGNIHMANLCLASCHSINGVSKLHTKILTEGIFNDYYKISPERFKNVTNGIAYRRWLCQANPELSDFLSELIGDDFKNDSFELTKLLDYKDDTNVLDKLRSIKQHNKEKMCKYISDVNGINVDTNSIFDVQIKRLHEYKRQLLNALQIMSMYREIKDNPNMDFVPRSFIFASKASSGYFMAKQIIRLIVALSNTINSDPAVRDKLKVIFLEDYRVSLAEKIIPSAEISEQISIAGKEASGTGNMKLMINGAITLGTLDGANVEILEQVGHDNIFLFGLKANEVENMWKNGYSPIEFLRKNPKLQAVVDMLNSNVLGARFDDITKSLLTNSYGSADSYMCFADFDSYREAHKRVDSTYRDKNKFTKMSLVNIAKSGVFSSDRAIEEYAKNIWNI